MQKAVKSMMHLLTYTPPADVESFELLEEAQEEAGRGPEMAELGGPTANQNEPEAVSSAAKRHARKAAARSKKDDACNNVYGTVAENLDRLRKEFHSPANDDLYIREFKISQNTGAAIAFINGMTDRELLNDFVLRPIMLSDQLAQIQESSIIGYIADHVLTVYHIEKTSQLVNDVIFNMLNGFTALFVDGCSECLVIDSNWYEKRGIEKPATETTTKGSQEAFTENLRTNITQIRRIVRNKNLVTQKVSIRSTNNFTCAILYLDGVVNPKLLQEVNRRLHSVEADNISSDGMLEQLIEDKPFTFFPQVLSTERPDRAASFILNGQVVVVSEGSPFILAVPVTFFHMFQTSEDANMKWQFSTALRGIRILGILFSALLPGVYLALTLFHREMIPTELLVSIARAKESIPFPGLIEVLIMEISFEIIREAGIRVPGVIGPTLGIIGALILGQAAVAADLVSPVLIIVVAITGLGNFAIPNYAFATSIRILRFLFIFVGCMAGFYGIAACLAIVMVGLCDLKSFGVPFLSPIAPRTRRSTDLFLRRPIWKQKERPDYLNVSDRYRQTTQPRGWKKRTGGSDNA
jgi:spore germination protein KA